MVKYLTDPAGELTVVPPDRKNWPRDPKCEMASVYIVITLDLATGRLGYWASPEFKGRPKGIKPEDWYSSLAAGTGFRLMVASEVTWEFHEHIPVEEAEQLQELIAAHARVILTELVPIEGRAAGGFDWSLRAAAAVARIEVLTSDWRRALSNPEDALRPYDFNRLADMHEVLAGAPELERPEWAVMTDAELDAEVEALSQTMPPEMRVRIIAVGHVPDRFFDVIQVVGVLSALHRVRRERAGDRTPVDACAWFAERPTRLSVVEASSSDAELAEIAAAEERAAALKGKLLLRGREFVLAVRTEKREQIRRRLWAIGAEAAELGDRYEQARSTRAALVLQIDSWGDPADGTERNRNAVLARMAGVKRQSVSALRDHAHAVNTMAPSSDGEGD